MRKIHEGRKHLATIEAFLTSRLEQGDPRTGCGGHHVAAAHTSAARKTQQYFEIFGCLSLFFVHVAWHPEVRCGNNSFGLQTFDPKRCLRCSQPQRCKIACSIALCMGSSNTKGYASGSTSLIGGPCEPKASQVRL